MISKFKKLLFAFFLITISGFSQEMKKSDEVKTLVIIDGKYKLWTQQEKNDSINWSNLKSVDVMSDSIARIKKYGEKAKYGVMILNYRNSTPKKEERE